MEKLFSSKDIASNKLIILYLLIKLKPAVNSTQLTKIILDYHYMDFFSFRQHLNELTVSGFVTSSSPDGEHGITKQCVYSVSKDGEELFEELKELMPSVEKNRIDRTIGNVFRQVREEIAVTADYIPEDKHRNTVCLKITEGSTVIMQIELLTGSKKDARMLCNNWKSHTQTLYSQIVDTLIGVNSSEEGVQPTDAIDGNGINSTPNDENKANKT